MACSAPKKYYELSAVANTSVTKFFSGDGLSSFQRLLLLLLPLDQFQNVHGSVTTTT